MCAVRSYYIYAHSSYNSSFCTHYSSNKEIYMSRSTRKTTLLTLRNVSTQISLRSPRRLIRVCTFRPRGIKVYRNDSWNIKSTGGEKGLSGLAFTACLGWSGSIIYAESTGLVISWNGSYINDIFYYTNFFLYIYLWYLCQTFNVIWLYTHICVFQLYP